MKLARELGVPVVPVVDLRRRLGRTPDVDDGYKLVTSTTQRTLTRLGNERSLPLIG